MVFSERSYLFHFSFSALFVVPFFFFLATLYSSSFSLANVKYLFKKKKTVISYVVVVLTRLKQATKAPFFFPLLSIPSHSVHVYINWKTHYHLVCILGVVFGLP